MVLKERHVTGPVNNQSLNTGEFKDIGQYCLTLADQAKAAARQVSIADGTRRNEALRCMAELLSQRTDALKNANQIDLDAGKAAGLSTAMLDRLELTEKRIQSMVDSLEQVIQQTDPVGMVVEGRVLPNGIRLEKVRVPIGVVLIIYESRPNVTCDAAALCLKSGNSVILRGGKEAIHSNHAIAACIREAITKVGLDPDTVQLVMTTEREAVGRLLKMEGQIDLCIPRGGESLIRAVVEQAHIPVIKHYAGNCHLYIDSHADPDMAIQIAINAKTQRPGVCNAAETLLIHRQAAEDGLLQGICKQLAERNVEIRGDEATCRLFSEAAGATDADWHTEYLDLIMAVRVVDSIEQAIEHINRYGSRHTDAIVTRDLKAANQFVRQVDSANVFVNCSTRFSDGNQYGLGAEIGISTDKLHARGPMGAEDLTTSKWVAYGDGQLRS